MKQNQKLGKVADTEADKPKAASVTFDQFRGRMIAPQVSATELGISEFTVHRWIREGKIRAVKLSARCTRIDGDSLAEYMMANTFVPGEKEEQPEQFRGHRGKNGKATTSELSGQA